MALYKVEASYFIPNFSTYATILFTAIGMVLTQLMILMGEKESIYISNPRSSITATIGMTIFVLSIYSIFSVLFIRPMYLRGEPWMMVSRSTATLQDILEAKLRAFFTLALTVWAVLSSILDLIINTIAVRGGIVLNVAERLLLPFIILTIISFGALSVLMGSVVDLNVSRNAATPNAAMFFVYFSAMFALPAFFMMGSMYYNSMIIGYLIYGLIALVCLIIYAWLRSKDFKSLKDKLPRLMD